MMTMITLVPYREAANTGQRH